MEAFPQCSHEAHLEFAKKAPKGFLDCGKQDSLV